MVKGEKKVIEEKKIIVKSKNREEVRFALYKDTFKMELQFIPKSLDLTEKQLLELIRKAIIR